MMCSQYVRLYILMQTSGQRQTLSDTHKVIVTHWNIAAQRVKHGTNNLRFIGLMYTFNADFNLYGNKSIYLIQSYYCILANAIQAFCVFQEYSVMLYAASDTASRELRRGRCGLGGLKETHSSLREMGIPSKNTMLLQMATRTITRTRKCKNYLFVLQKADPEGLQACITSCNPKLCLQLNLI